MGVMDKVLVFEAVVLIVYTIADMAVFGTPARSRRL